MTDPESSTIVLTRQELFEKVWTTPMIRLAKGFGLRMSREAALNSIGKIVPKLRLTLRSQFHQLREHSPRGVCVACAAMGDGQRD